MDIFDFMQDIDNYEERKVANFQKGDLVIDTCAVSDSINPYETGICHPDYNDGDWVIVETYEDPDAAMEGHTVIAVISETGDSLFGSEPRMGHT